MSGAVRTRLAVWSAAAAAALDAALDGAAEELAADISRQVSAWETAGDDAAIVTVGRDAVGQRTVAVTHPDAEAREFGTRAVPARPFLRPRVAALRAGLRARVAAVLRNALSGGMNR